MRPFHRLTALFFGIAIFATVSAQAVLAQDAGQPKLNFVFILIDDMGWKDVGCNGSTFYQTPNIDHLAAQGMPGDYKLIEFYEDGNVELYNLRDDISEKTDLSSQLPQKAKEMRDMLKEWRNAVDAQMPTPNPDYKP
jgi:arylsulfatase A-like enzyme